MPKSVSFRNDLFYGKHSRTFFSGKKGIREKFVPKFSFSSGRPDVVRSRLIRNMRELMENTETHFKGRINYTNEDSIPLESKAAMLLACDQYGAHHLPNAILIEEEVFTGTGFKKQDDSLSFVICERDELQGAFEGYSSTVLERAFSLLRTSIHFSNVIGKNLVSQVIVQNETGTKRLVMVAAHFIENPGTKLADYFI